jgi:cardiolipin synthase
MRQRLNKNTVTEQGAVLALHHIPNALCVLRMLLAFPVALLLVRGEYVQTLIVFGLAAVTDGLDGFLAKRFNWTSELGKALDPLADKILLVTTFAALTYLRIVPLWLAVPVVLRDLIITAGAIAYVRWFGPLTEAKPTLISKLNTLFQIGFIISSVATRAFEMDWHTLNVVLATLVIVTTVCSGIDYIATYFQLALKVSRARGRTTP